MKNKDNKVIAEKLESNFTPNVVVKTQEDKKQEELGKYFEEYGEYRPRGSSPSANIVKIIETNGPVHIDEIYDCMKVLTGRIATKKFKSEIRELLMSFKDSIKNDGDFYFEKNYNFEEMKVRRRVLPKIERICPKEIEKSIIYTLELQYSLSKDDLIKAASSYLGFKAVRKNIKDTYEMIISDMKSDKVIKETNGIMELIK